MNKKELVAEVVSKFDLKPGQANKVVNHVLEQILSAGMSGEGFTSPAFRVVSKDLPERSVEQAEGGTKTLGAQRILRIVPISKNENSNA